MNSLTRFALAAPLLLLTGCALRTTSGPELSPAPAAFSGKLMGGQQPIFGATVSIYEVGSSGYGVASTTPKATTTSGLTDGSYSFAASSYTCTASNTPMYLVATGGTPGGYSTNASSALMALIPQCGAGRSSYIIINELTTAAAVLAAGPFMSATLGAAATPQIGGTCTSCATGTYNKGLVAAFSNTYPMLVDNPSGTALNSGVANSITVTRETAKLNSIGNVLAACVNSNGATSTTETTTTCGKLFTGVNATSATTRPSNTLQAGLLMTLYPYYNVALVFALGAATPPFIGLSTAPNDWTTAISYTTPLFGLGIAQNTSSNLDIDASGNIWFPSNQTGTAGLAYFSPGSTTFNGPYGGITITNPQYVSIDQSAAGVAWVTDLNSANIAGVLTTAPGSVTRLTSSLYATGGPLALDNSNNVLFAGNGTTHHLYVINAARTAITQAGYNVSGQSGTYTPSGSPNGIGVPLTVPYTNGYVYAVDTGNACELEFSPGASADDRQTTGTSTCVTGGELSVLYANQAYATTSTNTLCYYIPFQSVQGCPSFAFLSNPKGLAADGAGRAWVANAGNSSVALFGTAGFGAPSAVGAGYKHGAGNGATLTTPYGIGVDASGSVWVSNASCVSTSTTACVASGFTLTQIVGAAAPTITPISAQEIGNTTTYGTKPTS